MDAPLVTVITVTYNSSLYVRDTIESVLSQTHSHLQYVIADDCSTDNTWEIIQQYNDPRITAYRNEANLGEYPNRNKAISYATGEYLIFIDGDDVIYPHGIAFFVNMMQQFPGAALAIQKEYTNNVLYPALLYPEDSMRNYYFGKENLLSSSFASDFYRTDAIKAAGFLSEKYVGGDNLIRLMVALKKPVLLVAGWVSWPRETPGQASSRMSLETQYVEHFRIASELENANDPELVQPSVWQSINRNNRRSLARFILRTIAQGNFKLANRVRTKGELKWGELYKTAMLKGENHDFLAGYSPAKPFKRGFLNQLATPSTSRLK
ncbi:glycosyltransferase family 2 protein [Segetibacter sp. 3557_3]|uniref:glycosyltransferase family 2 protein n=1 Tax=Segetibacter sp. 3557_3 TaxID=2547429 RepID=UPI0010588BF0|nr:glycosyltransferase family 2 protein [Segetibacter sp. 3557_3]TDH23298.1 glycosyltransferase family 2 protein [Segetibacter sp. 3557_3]